MIEWKNLKESITYILKYYKTGNIKDDYYNTVNLLNIEDFTRRLISFEDKSTNYFIEKESSILYKRVVNYIDNFLIVPTCTAYIDLDEYRDFFSHIYLRILNNDNYNNDIDLYLGELYLNEADLKSFILQFGNECMSIIQNKELNLEIKSNSENKKIERL